MFSIESLISKKSIDSHFQPIVSAEEKKIIGFEALCRGVGEFEGIPTDYLFSEAKKQNHLLELDRLCRQIACSNFAKESFQDCLLFINFNASIIDKGVLGSKLLYETVLKNQLKPENIVLEIVESKVKDIESLKKFITFYRDLGFTIALDDIGSAYSNLERIAMLKPDILKIDRSIIQNIDKEYYKQEIIKAFVNLGKSIGSLIIAEGVESEKEALTSLELGVTMLQGYYFAKPAPLKELDIRFLNNNISSLGEIYKKNILKKKEAEIKNNVIEEKALHQLIDIIKKTKCFLPLSLEKDFLTLFPNIECFYFLNRNGTQISDTFFLEDKVKKTKSPLYKPGLKGNDHSVKDYFYQLKDSRKNYYKTSPYLSKASGNLCTTLSSSFKDENGGHLILCIDLLINNSIKP